MAESRGLDVRAMVIGLLVGILLTIIASSTKGNSASTAPTSFSSSGPTETPVIGAAPQQAPMASWLQQHSIEQSLEGRVQDHLDKLIGKDRSKVSIRVTQWEYHNAAPTVSQLSMALSFDSTKVVYDQRTNEYVERVRSQEEIERLTALAQRVAGFEPGRDQLVVLTMYFDPLQGLAARMDAESEEEIRFWFKITTIVMVLMVVVFVGWLLYRQGSAALKVFFDSSASLAILFLSGGVVLSASAIGLWGSGLGWRGVWAFIGLFLLLMGLLRLSRDVRAPSLAESEP